MRGMWVGHYLVAAVIFGLMDFVWLTIVALPMYEAELGDLLAESPNMPAALAFYVIYIGGVTYFASNPAILAGSLRKAVVSGAVLGLVAYATWDLTNLAVLEGFPATVVAADLAWGAFATAATAGLTYAVCRRIPALHPTSHPPRPPRVGDGNSRSEAAQ
ncbi:MAG: DUF2177 family protein [Ornithinimicrobium sp.]